MVAIAVPPAVAWACELTKVTPSGLEAGWFRYCSFASERSAGVLGWVESEGPVFQMKRPQWQRQASRMLLDSLLGGRTSA